MSAKKLITGFLAGSMMLMPMFTSVEASIDSDKQKLNELRQQYDQRIKQIAQLKGQEQDLEKKIALVNQQIAEFDQQINALQADIEAGAAKIREKEIEIKKTQDKLEARKNMLKQRLRVMYEDGNVSYLDVLFQSTDFSDFIDRMSTLSLVVNQDKKLVESIKEEKRKLDEIQAQLKQEQDVRLVRQDALSQAKKEQDNLKAQQSQLLAEVQKNRQISEEAARKEQEEMAAVEASIVAQVKAQEEAARARLEAMRQRNSGGGSGGSHSSTGWAWPVPSSHTISSGYGQRSGGFHAGVDIAAPVGAPIVAVDDGIVMFAGTASGFGHWVVIKHPSGVLSVYGHMYGNQISVSVGQEVSKGQVIAAVGSDGESSGPHLHFAVSGGITGSSMNYQNPNPYLGL